MSPAAPAAGQTILESFAAGRSSPFGVLEAASGAHPPDPSQGRVTTFAFARLARAASRDARIETDAPSKRSIRSRTAGGSATSPPTVSFMPLFRRNRSRAAVMTGIRS